MQAIEIFRHVRRYGIGTFILAPILLGGCGGYSSSGTYTPTTTLTGIAITPSSDFLPIGSALHMVAIGSYSNGTSADITSSVTWISANPATISVTSAGTATANAAGTTSISATASGGGYGVVTGSTAVTVLAGTVSLTGITIAPVTMSIARGTTTTFTATGGFLDSSNSISSSGNVSGSAAWSSSDPTIATINSSGIATGVMAGTVSITASMNGISDTASLTVF